MKTSHLAVLALALTGFSSEALAWGADGHRAVAAIALKLLPPRQGPGDGQPVEQFGRRPRICRRRQLRR